MNAVQQEYFADVTVDFLSGSSGGERVLDLQIDDQIDNDGSIQVIGKLLGASYQPVAAFARGLESSFREGQDAYVQRLIFDRLRPNDINEVGGIELFEGISSVGGTVDVDTDAPARPQMDDGGGSSSLLIIAIVSAVGGIALILLVCWFCLSRRKSAEERREVKRYRERMKVEMRARRQDGKEILIGKGDNPEDTHNYREGIASTSDEFSDGQHVPSSVDDDRQSIVADDVEFADFPGDRSDKGQRSIPANSPPLPPREKAQLRSVKPLGDDLPGSSERRAVPRSAKPDVEDSQKPNAATPPTQKGASPVEVSKFMAEQPKLPTKKVSESHSVQYQPPTVLRGVKEDVPPGTPGSSLKKPQLRSVKSLGDDPPSSPRKRAAHKPTKSMDSNEFPPGKRPGASPAALSRFMKAEPKKSANKLSGSRSVQLPPASGPTSKKVKEAEDVPSESPRKWPLFRGNTKSQDESNFKGELSQNTRLGKINEGGDTPGTASGAPTSANLKSASPAELSKFMKEKPKSPTKKLSGSRSVQYQPPSALGATPKKFKEAEDVPSGSPRKRPPFGKTKSLD
jgi:hypothetical protein